MGFASYLEDITNRCIDALRDVRQLNDSLSAFAATQSTSRHVGETKTDHVVPSQQFVAQQVSSLLSKVEILERKLSKMLSYATDPDLRVPELNERIAELEECNARLESSNAKLVARAEKIERQRDEAQGELAQLRKQLASLRTQQITGGQASEQSSREGRIRDKKARR